MTQGTVTVPDLVCCQYPSCHPTVLQVCRDCRTQRCCAEPVWEGALPALTCLLWEKQRHRAVQWVALQSTCLAVTTNALHCPIGWGALSCWHRGGREQRSTACWQLLLCPRYGTGGCRKQLRREKSIVNLLVMTPSSVPWGGCWGSSPSLSLESASLTHAGAEGCGSVGQHVPRSQGRVERSSSSCRTRCSKLTSLAPGDSALLQGACADQSSHLCMLVAL